ncbi:kinase-like protein [Thelephora terrestris]|uniref:Kinase-like protein n=1 Tax=Thelephora terrestris TaxID=56493 RepID=A0A9P6L762_9AGAM|nr:kinase-like protein [Thelephora terrestris]
MGLIVRGYHALDSSFGKVFNVEKRWKIIREMGSGAYGFVVSAADEITGEVVAIKLVTRVTERIQLSKRALREITLLRHLSHHENITGLIDVDASSPNLEEMCIIKSGQTLTSEHVQYFVYQILRASVVHRDLKPGNLLVNADCELKICDFGLSRGFDALPDGEVSMTEYVATRWYRAPEIMLASRKYGTAIDVWSIGCIFAELLLSKPIFKGKDYVDQLNKIIDVLGTPSQETITRVGSQKAQAYIRSLPMRKATPFEKLLPDADAQAIDLLRRMVTFDPTDRISVAEALKHPWLSTYHNPDDEPDCVESFQRWKEVEELETHDEFKKALWEEIQDYRREVRGLNSSSGSPVTMKRTSSASSHSMVDTQTQPSATTTGLGKIEEETAADLKSGTTRSSSPASPHQNEEPTTTETSPLPAEIEPFQARSESQSTLPPSEPLPPLPPQDNQQPRPISKINSKGGEQRPSSDKLERASSTASNTTPTDPVMTYARRTSFLQPQQPSVPNSGRSSPVHPYHPSNHASRKPISNVGGGGYFDGGVNLREKYGHGKHLNRNTVAFPTGEAFIVPARTRSSSTFGPSPLGVALPSSTYAGDGVSGLLGSYNYTVGPGIVGRLLRTLSTVSIHESGQGLKGGLADIAPIGKFITERGSDDELLASDVPEEFKEGGFKDGDRDGGKDAVRKGRKRKGTGLFNL